MKRDPNNVEDLSKDRSVDWDREVQSGNLVPTTGLTKDTNKPGFLHVQGRPLSEAEMQARVIPKEVAKHMAETGRYPDPPSQRGFFMGGWPTFDKDGKIVP